MGFIQGHGQEKILFPMLLEKIQCPVGTAVSEGKLRGNSLLICSVVAGCQPLFLRQFLQVTAHVVPVFRVPSLRTDTHAKVIAAVQMPFPDIGRANPIVGKALTDGFYISPQGNAVRETAVGMGICTGKQGRTGRTADWLTSVGVLAADSLRGQAVKIWCVHIRITVAPHHVLTRGVRH